MLNSTRLLLPVLTRQTFNLCLSQRTILTKSIRYFATTPPPNNPGGLDKKTDDKNISKKTPIKDSDRSSKVAPKEEEDEDEEEDEGDETKDKYDLIEDPAVTEEEKEITAAMRQIYRGMLVVCVQTLVVSTNKNALSYLVRRSI